MRRRIPVSAPLVEIRTQGSILDGPDQMTFLTGALKGCRETVTLIIPATAAGRRVRQRMEIQLSNVRFENGSGFSFIFEGYVPRMRKNVKGFYDSRDDAPSRGFYEFI